MYRLTKPVFASVIDGPLDIQRSLALWCYEAQTSAVPGVATNSMPCATLESTTVCGWSSARRGVEISAAAAMSLPVLTAGDE